MEFDAMISNPIQNIKDMLADSKINFREHGNELITHCIFNDCDSDSRGNEAHMYINATTGQYFCHKCGEKGGINGLREALGVSTQSPRRQASDQSSSPNKLATKYHNQLPLNIREWLKNNRLLLEEDIDDYELGYGVFYGKSWITIPV